MVEPGRRREKIIQDPVHGPIKLKHLNLLIIDTPEFQRLRSLKQLGCTYLVYPSATHTRFEHCIGTSYLAETFATKIIPKDEKERDSYIKCVAIAGLCHDLGHGPFSHVWETFMRSLDPPRDFKHEDMSIRIFKRIWDTKEEIRNQISVSEKNLICNIIKGDSVEGYPNYLFQIVNNKISGNDVDKWDYLLRDSYYLGIKIAFGCKRLMELAKIVDGDICFRRSEFSNVSQIFQTRYLLHVKAYQHKKGKVVEKMFVDVLLSVAKENIIGRVPLEETCEDVEKFLLLNDFIYHHIKLLKEEDNPFRKIEERKFPRITDEQITETSKNVEILEEQMKNKLGENHSGFYIQEIRFDYGKQSEDPVQKVNFYTEKNARNRTNIKVQKVSEMVPKMVPSCFQEFHYYCVFYNEDEREVITEAFNELFSSKEIIHTLSKKGNIIDSATVYLGEHNRLSADEDRVIASGIKVFANHYSKKKHYNDIALIQLSHPVNITTDVQPACIAKENSDFIDKKATAIGWGALGSDKGISDVLREVDLPVLPDETCKSSYKERYYPEVMLCAGFTDGAKDTCQGDSGGPLFTRKDEKFTIIGITSFGQGCAAKGYPGVYVRISNFQKWITKIASEGGDVCVQ